jgi:hypothetical protein
MRTLYARSNFSRQYYRSKLAWRTCHDDRTRNSCGADFDSLQRSELFAALIGQNDARETAFGRSFCLASCGPFHIPVSATALKCGQNTVTGCGHEAKIVLQSEKILRQTDEKAAECSVYRGASIASDDSQLRVRQATLAARFRLITLRAAWS